MSKAISANLVVNLVGAVAATLVVGWVIYSMRESDAPQICEGRYPSSTRFSLTGPQGKALSDSELQARLGLSEWGILDNGEIVRDESAPVSPVLEVRIAKGTGSGFNTTIPRGGISFQWSPFEMSEQAPQSACLSYHVFLPEDFQFAGTGSLPSLFVGRDFDPRGETMKGGGSAARVGWLRDGRATVSLQYASKDGWVNPEIVATNTQWPLGRWVAVEQEVILNSIGKRDGIVRLWFDGQFAGESKGVALRNKSDLSLGGVLADVQYGSVNNVGTAPKGTKVRMTPFVIRWK